MAGVLGTAAFPLAYPFTDGKEIFASGVLEPLAFVCLLPVLIATRGLSVQKTFWVGVLAGEIFFTTVFWWVNVAMTTFGGMPNALSVPVLLMLAGWCAYHWGVAFGLTRYFELRHGWPAAVTFAPLWTASELLRNYLFSGFPWANLGYTQARNLWLSQIGSVVGVYGIAALIAFVNITLYEVWRWRVKKERSLPTRLIAISVAALVVGHVYGAIRVHLVSEELASAPKVQVAVIQGNIDQKLKNTQGSHARMVLDAYNPPTVAADASGADLIVWPEAAYPISFPMSNMDVRQKGLAKPEYRASFVLGVDRYDELNRRVGENSAYVLDPKLSVTSVYTKYHLVPFGEYVLFDLDKLLPIDNLVPGTFRPGTSLDPVAFKAVSLGGRETKIGMEICYDGIFPEISRTYARRGAEILVNITNDAWYGLSAAPYQFMRIVAMRAIETGRPVARAANTGISGFIDPLGRLSGTTGLGIIKSDQNLVDASLRMPAEWRIASLPLLSMTTPYVVLGDLPSYGAAAFAVFGVLWGWRKSWRERRGRATKA